MTDQQPLKDEWQQLKPAAEHALKNLLTEISAHKDDPQSLFEAYTYAKEISARAIQSRMLAYLPGENEQFRTLRTKIEQEMHARYRDVVPERLLTVPYGSKTHERLFSLLQENLATPVHSAMLRIVTGDDVHTERRARELRELGLDVDWGSREGINTYELRSLELDFDLVPAMVRNKIRQTKSLRADQRKQILRDAGIPEDG